MIDVHVYCLPPRLRDLEVSLPASEGPIIESIYRHTDRKYAMSLSSPKSIIRSMEENGVEKSVLIAFPWSDRELCRETNDYLLELVAKHDRFYAICSVQPKERDWDVEVNRVINAGALGLKINPVWQDFELDSPEVDVFAEFLQERNVPLMIHVDQAFRRSKSSPAHLFTFIQRHRDLRILAAHLGGLLGLYNLHAPIRELFVNLWFDTAISSTLQMVEFYRQAGLGDKIIFGSDFPFNHSHSQSQVISGIHMLNLPKDVEEDILSNNFYRFINRHSELQIK